MEKVKTVYIFKMNPILRQAHLEAIRDALIKQINEGCVLLDGKLDFMGCIDMDGAGDTDVKFMEFIERTITHDDTLPREKV